MIKFLLIFLCTVSFGISLNCYSCGPSKNCELKSTTCPKRVAENTLIKNFVGKISCFSATYKVFGENFTHKGCSIDGSRSLGELNFVSKNDAEIKEGLNILPNVEKYYESCEENYCNNSNNSKKLSYNISIVIYFMFVAFSAFYVFL